MRPSDSQGQYCEYEQLFKRVSLKWSLGEPHRFESRIFNIFEISQSKSNFQAYSLEKGKSVQESLQACGRLNNQASSNGCREDCHRIYLKGVLLCLTIETRDRSPHH